MNETTKNPPAATSTPAGRSFVLGTETRTTILTTGEESGGRFDVTDSTQIPGARTPLHLHTRYEERLCVLEGTLTIWLGEETRKLGPGDYVTIPTRVPHAIEVGDEGARAINITSPPGFAELIMRAGTPEDQATDSTELDLDLFVKVSTELGDVVLGPPGTVPADLAEDSTVD
ncbi:cupin domain-containing protein [Nocardiopsis alkaliphila]|uniref:cupin domain-containing protein n=1 Tax=Nocardiopsis alkaliphila TaxID=225762 RepID=UPI00034847F4|nr:cupin domain-containing protein [Nocardiopsis alkaliphila]